MFYIAHRGYTENYPDNSLHAFKEAIYHGFQMIEMDIQICKTREIVIYHDVSIDNKYICNMTYEELKPYNIVTLVDFYKEIDCSTISVYLDLKGGTDLIESLIGFFLRENIDTSNIYIASFNFKHLFLLSFYQNNLNRLDYKIGAITSNVFDRHMCDDLFNTLNFICIEWSMLDTEMISWCRKKNIKVFTYTCNSRDSYECIMNYDVDGIVSDILLPPLNL